MDTSAPDTLSMKDQVKMLYHFMKICDNDSLFHNVKLYKDYLANDTCHFSRYLLEKDEFKEQMGVEVYEALNKNKEHENLHLLQERNEAWIPVIEHNIATRPSLIAVGCKHLLSENGLIAMLRREGYNVRPIIQEE